MRGVAKTRKKDEVASPLLCLLNKEQSFIMQQYIAFCHFLNAPTDVAKEAGGWKEKHKKQSSYARSSWWRDMCVCVCNNITY